MDLQYYPESPRRADMFCFQMDMPASLPFSKSFDYASGATGERFQNPFWKLKEYIFGAPFRKAVFEVKQFGDEIVSAAVDKRQASASKAEDETKTENPLQNNLINSLLDHIEDRQVVADAAMNYLSAGKSSASPLTLAILSIPTHRPRHDSPIPNLDLLLPNAPPTHHPENLLGTIRYPNPFILQLNPTHHPPLHNRPLQRSPAPLPPSPHRTKRMHRPNHIPRRNPAAKRRHRDMGHLGYGSLKVHLGRGC